MSSEIVFGSTEEIKVQATLALDISLRLWKLMEKKRLNVDQLSTITKIDKPYLECVLRAEKNITLCTIARLSLALKEDILIVPETEGYVE